MSELGSARLQFRENARDLSRLVTGREKDPIPEDPDLQILVQASKLEPKPVMIVTKDSHFIGYTDLIEEWYQIVVIDAVRLPLVLDEWRNL